MSTQYDIYDAQVAIAIINVSSNRISQVLDLIGINDLIHTLDTYNTIEELIKSGDIEKIKTLSSENNFQAFRQYLHVYTFRDQNNNSFVATIYDSDALEQDPQVIKLYPL